MKPAETRQKDEPGCTISRFRSKCIALGTICGMLGLGMLVGGCGLFSDSSPRNVRVTVDGEVTTSIVLITSKEFNTIQVPNGAEPAKREVEIVVADTTTVFPPARKIVDISDTKRFMLRATRRRPDQDRLKLRVRIDGRLMYEYDASRMSVQDSTIQYVFIYRE